MMQKFILIGQLRIQAQTATRGSSLRTMCSTALLRQPKAPNADAQSSNAQSSTITAKDDPSTQNKRKKSIQELDEEMRNAMAGIEGDGGLAGAELEGGKAVSMKRGVRDNMFRYI